MRNQMKLDHPISAKKALVFWAMLFFSSNIVAQQEEVDARMEEVCFRNIPEMISAASSTKKNGASGHFLRQSIPRDEEATDEPYISMREILDDVFGNEIANIGLYKMYKANTCWLRLSGFPLRSTRYEDFSDELDKCDLANLEHLSACVARLAMSSVIASKPNLKL